MLVYYTRKLKMLKKFDETTKQYKLFQALVLNGETLSEAAIAKRFAIANPTATISQIRQRAKQRVAGNGVKVTEYQHGMASRKMVALAYKAQSLGISI